MQTTWHAGFRSSHIHDRPSPVAGGGSELKQNAYGEWFEYLLCLSSSSTLSEIYIVTIAVNNVRRNPCPHIA
jgi:hypothetical protein